MNKKLGGLFLALLCLMVITTIMGSVNVSLNEFKDIIIKFLFNTQTPVNEQNYVIITGIRLPRIILVVLVGMALAISGAIVQSVLNNPIATPYTLGVSSGAALGAGLVIITGLEVGLIGKFSMPLLGFVFGLVTIAIVIFIAQKTDHNLSDNSLILSGVIISLFLNAFLTLLSVFAFDKIQQITMWQLGSFASRGWEYLVILLPFLLFAFGWLLFYVKKLDLLSFGSDTAYSLGVNTTRSKKRLLIIATLLSSSSVAICGIIGFVDLIAPHLARKLVGANHRYLLIASALIGAILLLVADTIARTLLSPMELPIGAITALIGVPFFIYIYSRKVT